MEKPTITFKNVFGKKENKEFNKPNAKKVDQRDVVYYSSDIRKAKRRQHRNGLKRAKRFIQDNIPNGVKVSELDFIKVNTDTNGNVNWNKVIRTLSTRKPETNQES